MTSRNALEPTTFTLDVYFAGGSAGDAALDDHIAACPRCAAYLARLEALVSEPARSTTRVTPPPAVRSRTAARTLGAWASMGAFLLVAAWWLFTPAREPAYVASKGVPAVQALIRSQGRSYVWDGRASIRAGDAIALRAGCDQFLHLAVVTGPPDGQDLPDARVFDAACAQGDNPLPFTLVADHKPGVERIQVIFSHAHLDDDALRTAMSRTERSNAIWVTQLQLHKLVSKP